MKRPEHVSGSFHFLPPGRIRRRELGPREHTGMFEQGREEELFDGTILSSWPNPTWIRKVFRGCPKAFGPIASFQKSGRPNYWSVPLLGSDLLVILRAVESICVEDDISVRKHNLILIRILPLLEFAGKGAGVHDEMVFGTR